MTTGPIPLCESCLRLGPGSDGIGYACAAFPDGIPDAIYVEGADHRKPHPSDGGVRFDLAPGASARLAAYEAAHTVDSRYFAAIAYYISVQRDPPLLLRRRPVGNAYADEAYLGGDRVPTPIVVAWMFGNDDFVSEITDAEARDLEPSAF